MEISLQMNTDRDPRGNNMAFSANWQDAEFRYHVWIGIRPDIAGERPPYPVQVGETIYKNEIVHRYGQNTRKLDINAKSNAKIKAEIKRLAQYETLMAMFEGRRQEIELFDKTRAEAERLNRIFDAWKLLETATVDEKMTVGLI